MMNEADQDRHFADHAIVDGLERFNVGTFKTVTEASYWIEDWRSRHLSRTPNASIQQGPQGIFAMCWMRAENEQAKTNQS